MKLSDDIREHANEYENDGYCKVDVNRLNDWADKVIQLKADNVALKEQNIMENKINFGLDEEVQALQKQVEGLREFYDAHCEVEKGLLSFELHNEAVMRLRKAQEAIEGR